MNPIKVRSGTAVDWAVPVEVVYPAEMIFIPEVKPIRKRICIDLDGVVCEYDFPKIVKKHFGVELKAHEIYAYNLPDVLGVKQEDINIMFKEQIYGKPNFIEGAIDTLKGWRSKGYELVIFSNRMKFMSEFELAEWLINYQIPFGDIDDGGGEYDIHIDDSPAKLMATNSHMKLLYTQPWNERCLNIREQLIRVNNWQEVSLYV